MIAASLRMGMNSPPRNGKSARLAPNIATAADNTIRRCVSAQDRDGAYHCLAFRSSQGSSSVPLVRAIEHRAGESVSDSSNETSRAIMMV